MANGKLENKYRKKISNYQDFIIKNGRFIGKFEEMYQLIDDPWNYKKIGNQNIDYKIILNYCDLIKELNNKKNIKVLEVGCGIGILSNLLAKKGFKTYGFDISKTAIKKAKKRYKRKNLKFFVSNFDNLDLYQKINPNIYILSDISWYVLPKLRKFINFFRKKSAHLVHGLSIPDKQLYGKNYFQNKKSIEKFFNLKILANANLNYFSYEKKQIRKKIHTFFLAESDKFK